MKMVTLLSNHSMISVASKEFAARPESEYRPKNRRSGRINNHILHSWWGLFVMGSAAWVIQHQSNAKQLKNFVEGKKLFTQRVDDNHLVIYMDVTVALMNVSNTQYIQSLRQTRVEEGWIGNGCELLCCIKGSSNPDLVGIAHFEVWNSKNGQSKNPSDKKVLTFMKENSYC